MSISISAPASSPVNALSHSWQCGLLSAWATRIAALLLLLIAFAAIAAHWFYPDDPLDMVAEPLLWPGQDRSYPLGTDQLGRDVAAQLIHGTRVSLLVGVVAALVSLGIALLVGTAAGYFGGAVDRTANWLIETFQSMPSFLLVIAIVTILGPSAWVIALAVGLVAWPGLARLVRAEFRRLREHEFVLAAKTVGAGHWHLIFREILPNALPPLLAMASVEVAVAILAEAGLSFIGMGDPNAASWGGMIGNGRNFLRSEWFLCAIPGIAISITVLSVSLLSDGLNRALNPQSDVRVTR